MSLAVDQILIVAPSISLSIRIVTILKSLTPNNLPKAYSDFLQLDLLSEFERRYNRRWLANYQDREERNKFAATILKELAKNKILNIGGGGKRHLAKHLGTGYTVHEVDILGDCDTQLNLDSVNRLPFGDGTFDACCAFDVLEHLEHFHLTVEELFRIAASEVVISLPNSTYEILPNVVRNRPQRRPDMERGTFSKYYGLPLETPGDRHRWWIYFQDVIRFFVWFELTHECKVEFFLEGQAIWSKALKLILGKHLFYTFLSPHVWIRITKLPLPSSPSRVASW